MKLLPIREVTIETRLSADEVKRRLSQYVEKPIGWIGWYEHLLPFKRKPFVGEISGNSFHLLGRGGKIKGKIIDSESGAAINIKLNPIGNSIYTGLFLVFGGFYLFVVAKVIITIISTLTLNLKNLILALTVTGLPLFITYTFWVHALNSVLSYNKKFFTKLVGDQTLTEEDIL